VKVLVTGSHGRLGRVICAELLAAGHRVTGCDLVRPRYDGGDHVEAYLRVDVTDFGDVIAAMAGQDCVVHAAGIPDVRFDPAHRVYAVNALGAFNVAEAARVTGARRIVYISSETVTGLRFSRTRKTPRYLPIDDDHPNEPEDAYALSKLAGELAVRAVCHGGQVSGVILRPCWIQYPDTYQANIGPCRRDPAFLSDGLWGYVDGRDVATAVLAAVTADVSGCPVCFLSAADNAAGRPLADLVSAYYPAGIDIRTKRGDAVQSAFSIDRAARVLDWQPSHSWQSR
jgi:UDP-glucose 4-epimerase